MGPPPFLAGEKRFSPYSQVTLGMCLIGAVGWFRGALIVAIQLVGGMASAAVVSALFPGELAVSTELAGGASIAQGVFIEMFLTAQLVFTIFMLAAEKHKATFIAPVGMYETPYFPVARYGEADSS